MKASIKNKKEVAKGTLLVEFDTSPGEFKFEPGQYFFVSLIKPPYNDSKGERRHFTIVNSPNEENTLSFATRIRDSAFKKSIAELPVGTVVEVGPIDGEFTLPKDKDKKYVFLAGGIGITPFVSMLRYIREERLNYDITLIYSNRDRESTAFLEELQEISRDNPNIKLILTMTEDPDWVGERRKVNAGFMKEYLTGPETYYYMVAGTPGMVDAMKKVLKTAEVSGSNIKTENFPGY